MAASYGLVTFYVLFFIHVAIRRVHIAGISPDPDEKLMMQIARNETMSELGFLHGMRYLIHDRDGKSSPAFLRIIKDAGVELVKLPARSPNLNPIAEKRVRTAKEELLSKVILFSQEALWRTIKHPSDDYHEGRNHQGLGNRLLFPRTEVSQSEGTIECMERLGGVLKFYHHEAA